MITILNINITTLIIGWFIVNFQPLQSLFNWIYSKLPCKEWIHNTREHLECFKCVTFWTTLLVTQDIILAMFLSMIAYTYTRVINNMRTYL